MSLGCSQWKGFICLCSFSAPMLSLQVWQVMDLHNVCVPWSCGSAGVRLLTNLLCTGQCCFLLPASTASSRVAVTLGQRHSAYITGLEGEVSGERSLCVFPHSPGKLAGKSQAGLRFSASGVLGMVLEVQEDKTITSQHSDNHCPPCTARKVLFLQLCLQNH